MNKIDIAKSLIREAIHEEIEKGWKDTAKKVAVGAMIPLVMAGANHIGDKQINTISGPAKKMFEDSSNTTAHLRKIKGDEYMKKRQNFYDNAKKNVDTLVEKEKKGFDLPMTKRGKMHKQSKIVNTAALQSLKQTQIKE